MIVPTPITMSDATSGGRLGLIRPKIAPNAPTIPNTQSNAPAFSVPRPTESLTNPMKIAISPIITATGIPPFVRRNHNNDHKAATHVPTAPFAALASLGSNTTTAIPSGMPANEPIMPAKNASGLARRTKSAITSAIAPNTSTTSAMSSSEGSGPSTRTVTANIGISNTIDPSNIRAIRIGKPCCLCSRSNSRDKSRPCNSSSMIPRSLATPRPSSHSPISHKPFQPCPYRNNNE